MQVIQQLEITYTGKRSRDMRYLKNCIAHLDTSICLGSSVNLVSHSCQMRLSLPQYIREFRKIRATW